MREDFLADVKEITEDEEIQVDGEPGEESQVDGEMDKESRVDGEMGEEGQCKKGGLKGRLVASPLLHPTRCPEYLLTFLVIFGYQLIWVFQGFDVTDTGFHLTNQVAAFSVPVSGDVPAVIFLSDFFGGMWLALIGRPSLLWARLGFVLLNALNAVIVLRILVDHFSRWRAVLVVVVSAMVITSLYLVSIIHYFSFPTLLINIQLLLFHLLLKEERETGRWKLRMIMIGFMVVPIALSRINLVLLILAPVILILYDLLTKRKVPWLKDAFIYGLGGMVISLCIFTALLFSVGFLDVYVSWLSGFIGSGGNPGSSSHSASLLLPGYIRDVKFIGIVIGLTLIGGWMVNMIRERFGQRIADIGLPALFLLALITVYYLIFYRATVYRFTPLLLDKYTYSLAVMAFVILTVLIYITHKEKKREISYLLLLGLFICLIYPLGSNTGLIKGAYAAWLVLPLSFLVLWEMNEKTSINKGARETKLATRIFRWGEGIVSRSAPLLMVLLLIGSLAANYAYVYRDSHVRTDLDTGFESQGLEGIYSTEDRVRVVDELMTQLANYTEPGEKILFVNHIPMFYYLTETEPVYGNAWLLLRPYEAVEEMQREAVANGDLPKLFVYAKVFTPLIDWPNVNVTNTNPDKQEVLDFLVQEYTVDLGYTLLWENEAFAVYGNPEIFN